MLGGTAGNEQESTAVNPEQLMLWQLPQDIKKAQQKPCWSVNVSVGIGCKRSCAALFRAKVS